ncbi:MAG TPA: NlpC/P60 family protein [Abditibacteriaceae bacterium]
MNFRSLLVCGTFSALSLSLSLPAHADLYHVVESGDTLSSVATRYKVTTDVLRSINKLAETSDRAALPSMLLRVPENGKNTTTLSLPAVSGSAATVSSSARMTSNRASSPEPSATIGSISRSLTYTVQAGDTVESIVTRHAQNGYNVSTESVRARNDISGQPLAGRTIILPLNSTVYRAPAAAPVAAIQPSSFAPSSSTSSGFRTISSEEGELVGGAKLSDEMWMPTAREVPQGKPPVYQAPNAARSARRTPQLAQRGPTSLSSRSYSPSGDLDGVRVLGPREDAPNLGTTPQPRVRTVAPPSVPTVASKLAYVATVAGNGARIRRLPDAEAVTLYKCAAGTEIAVTKQSGPWSAILMSDRSTGWIPTRYLKMTGQSVDISSIPITEQNTPRRANKYAYTGNFSSNHPMVAQALTWLGTPYVYGGTSRRGIDCSALVQTSFRANGYSLPRTAAQQARVGMKVDPSNLREGDRLYFSASGSRVDHTGLYMGNGLFVHASGSGRSVIVSNLFDKRNWNIFVGARR